MNDKTTNTNENGRPGGDHAGTATLKFRHSGKRAFAMKIGGDCWRFAEIGGSLAVFEIGEERLKSLISRGEIEIEKGNI